MYKILFVSALAPELKIIKEEIKKLKISRKDLEISFFESWMGNYKTILNLTNYLWKNNFDFIVNIWVCWWTSFLKDNYPEKIIQVSRIFNLWNNKELISPIFFEFWNIESIFCSDKIIYDENILHINRGELDRETNFVDMESYWFELVLEKFETPRIILKVPVDKVWEETNNFNYEKAKSNLSENIDYNKLVLDIENFLESNNSEINNFSEEENDIKNKILNNYKFSFSEKIIMEKLLNKIIVLNLFNLEEFFLENNKLDKKSFLKILEEKI